MANESPSFSVVKPVLVVLALMLMISIMASWYGENVNMPRYCGKEERTIEILRKILTTKNPVVNESRREYIIASKLLFLKPKYNQEDIQGYLVRVEESIRKECNGE
jgi:hypothetical protein